MKKILIFGMIFLILIIFIIGCTQEKAESKTTKEMEKQIQTPPQQPITKTQIKVSGQGVEMIISPSLNNDLKDITTITVTKAPPNTATIGFAIIGPGIEALEKTGANLGYDYDGTDGWSFEFDTNSYPNDKYTLAVIAYSATRKSGEPPLGAAQAKIVIQNSEISPVPSPITTAPYKVIGGSCQYPLQSIEDAKRLNANTIAFGVIAGFTDEESGAAVWEPPEKAARGCAKSIALAHENSFRTVFGVSLADEEDVVIKKFNREKFVQTQGEMAKAYAAFAQENMVSIFSAANEVDSMASVATLQPLQTEEKTGLTEELSQKLIAEVKKVYYGKIAIGLAGVEPDEMVIPYCPFEGAHIICFSANGLQEENIESSLQKLRNSTRIMKGIGQQVGIQEVILCEVILFPEKVDVKFGTVGLNAAMKSLQEQLSFYDELSFQENEKEFYRRLISEVGSELSGMALPSGPAGPFSLKGRLAEKTAAEEFGKWE